jgi:hypothetical protein
MASWQYAFLFPDSQTRLRPAGAVGHLARLGLEFDSTIRLCVSIDEAGHLLDVGEEVSLTLPVLRDLIHYLEEGVSLSIQARSKEIAISCQFFTQSSNPHISLGWSRRLFETLTVKSQEAFWMTVRAFARDCGAAYVIIIDDAPDQFEDRFIPIGDKRLLDMEVSHRYGLGVRQVWIKTSSVPTPPEGPSYERFEEIGDGFRRYYVANDS